MMENSENNRTEEIVLVTPTSGHTVVDGLHMQ